MICQVAGPDSLPVSTHPVPVIFRLPGQLVPDVADQPPIYEILRLQQCHTRGVMVRRCDHVERITHTLDIHIRIIGIKNGISVSAEQSSRSCIIKYSSLTIMLKPKLVQQKSMVVDALVDLLGQRRA